MAAQVDFSGSWINMTKAEEPLKHLLNFLLPYISFTINSSLDRIWKVEAAWSEIGWRLNVGNWIRGLESGSAMQMMRVRFTKQVNGCFDFRTNQAFGMAIAISLGTLMQLYCTLLSRRWRCWETIWILSSKRSRFKVKIAFCSKIGLVFIYRKEIHVLYNVLIIWPHNAWYQSVQRCS